MINDREKENKVKKYADENNFTILANTFGTLEYVKYHYGKMRTTAFLKWPKGADSISVTREGITKKIKITEIE